MAEAWQTRLEEVYELIREMSLESDPQEMVRTYGRRVANLLQVDRRLSLSRRGQSDGVFHITRDSEVVNDVNPWKEKHLLPRLTGGLLGRLLYEGRPVVLNDFAADPEDPAWRWLEGYRSLMLIPMLDQGESINAVVMMKAEPNGFSNESLPDTFWLANLFGRATHSLVLKDEIRTAYDAIDRELKVVGRIQRSLLPTKTPDVATLDLAAYYRTSTRAGGDYYDFFPLANNQWGILVADVSGHGTPAAVVMAITHSIAHLYPCDAGRPGDLLEFVNGHLSGRYTTGIEAFVTAFYGIYDPATRRLTYASAGHNPPRWLQSATGQIVPLECEAGLPLGIMEDVQYGNHTVTLDVGDSVVLYTDGITEAHGSDGTLFEVDRLDRIIQQNICRSSEVLKEKILSELNTFTLGQSPLDDQTLVLMRVVS